MSFVPSLADIEEVRNVRGLQADRQTEDERIGDVQHKIREANCVYSKRTAFSFSGKEKKG